MAGLGDGVVVLVAGVRCCWLCAATILAIFLIFCIAKETEQQRQQKLQATNRREHQRQQPHWLEHQQKQPQQQDQQQLQQ